MDKYIREIPVVKVFQSKDGVQYVFWCNYCNCLHRHGAVSLGHRIAHCTNHYSPYLRDSYILKEYTLKELRELGIPTDHYSRHKKKTL